MTILELLDKAKNRANLKTDYALAKAMGVHTGTVANWRKGKQHPSDEEAVQLATLAGLDEMQVIAAIHYETATTEKKKEFWKTYLESHGLTATLGCVALGISLIVTPEPAAASVLQLQNYDAHNSVLETKGIYIMRTLGRDAQADERWLLATDLAAPHILSRGTPCHLTSLRFQAKFLTAPRRCYKVRKNPTATIAAESYCFPLNSAGSM